MMRAKYKEQHGKLYCAHGRIIGGNDCPKCESGDFPTPQKYRPSNGTEGCAFEAAWCADCKKEQPYRDTGEPSDGCHILANAYAFDIDDEQYPKEWVEDGLGPRCTAFDHVDTEDNPEPLDPNAVIRPLL